MKLSEKTDQCRDLIPFSNESEDIARLTQQSLLCLTKKIWMILYHHVKLL